jgi:type 1 glutamine amidotransferase
MKTRPLLLAALAVLPILGLAAEPKRLLVVGASVGFRHGSIPNTEKLLRDLAAKSNGEFTVTMMSDAPDYPFPRVQTPLGTTGTNGGLGTPTGFPGTIPGANAELQAAIGNAAGPLMPGLATAATAARAALVDASFRNPGQIAALTSALATAEANLAMARADALTRLQASANRITPAQIQNLAGNFPPAAGRGGANQNETLARIFQAYMGPEALKNYDAVVFVSTTGNLPIPDEKAFLDWVAAGHPVIALHASLDRGATSDAQMEMLSGGARFAGHPGNGNNYRKIYTVDSQHPATKGWPDGVTIVDEYYQFYHMGPAGRIPGVDWSKVHSLLDMDFEGTRMPVAWTKMYGQGRVFYTSLGHRDDVVLPFVNNLDYGYERENGNWIAFAYQKHLLEGIRWALGFTEGDTTLGNHPK